MGIRIKDFERSSWASQMIRHPIVVLPPNSNNMWFTSTAGTVFNTLVPIAITASQTSVRAFGGACSVNIHLTGGTTFTAAKFVDFELTGRDENHMPVVELLRAVGNAGATATQDFATKGLFSALDSLRVLLSSNDLVATELFTIGPTDGQNPLVSPLRLANPIPGAPLGQFAMVPNGVAPPGAVPTSITADGKQLGITAGYGAAGTVIRLGTWISALDGLTLEHS